MRIELTCRWVATGIAAAMLAAATMSACIARAAQVPAPDPSQGDGGVSTFYTWGGAIPDAPGKLLRSEPLDPALGLAAAGAQFRILYTSTDGIGGTARRRLEAAGLGARHHWHRRHLRAVVERPLAARRGLPQRLAQPGLCDRRHRSSSVGGARLCL
jgi:hypothetical protein